MSLNSGANMPLITGNLAYPMNLVTITSLILFWWISFCFQSYSASSSSSSYAPTSRGHYHHHHHIHQPIPSSRRGVPEEVNFSFSQEDYNHGSIEDLMDGRIVARRQPKHQRQGENDETDSNDDQPGRLVPEFVGQLANVTVQIGREARLTCIVRNLGTYRTAWIRDDEKSILTLQRQMVTRDPRISLQEESQIDGGADQFNGGDLGGNNQTPNKIRYFVLIIRNVQFSDRGGYMCQINTVPMKSQIGYLSVVVPPDIIDHESSNDVLVREGDNVTMKCKARGHPEPEIEWRREDGARVPLGDRNNNRRIVTNKTEGENLEITRVTRVHSGAWLCIASNGVMPSVSRRILLNVQFSPQIWIPTEEIGAPFGSNVTLDCHIEAYPLPLNYWTFGVHSESIYISGPKYEVSVKEKGYKRHLKLTIQKLTKEDLGTYKCHAQNSLGKQVKQVRIYASKVHHQIQSKLDQMELQQPNNGGGQHGSIQRPMLIGSSSGKDPSFDPEQRPLATAGRKRRKKKKRPTTKFDQNNDQLMMTNSSDQNDYNKSAKQEHDSSDNNSHVGGLLYSVINSFGTRQPQRPQSGNKGHKSDFQFQFYDNQEEEEEDGDGDYDDLEDYQDGYFDKNNISSSSLSCHYFNPCSRLSLKFSLILLSLLLIF